MVTQFGNFILKKHTLSKVKFKSNS